eukprot:297846-Chlamydomonas_euryale.AAC.1
MAAALETTPHAWVCAAFVFTQPLPWRDLLTGGPTGAKWASHSAGCASPRQRCRRVRIREALIRA